MISGYKTLPPIQLANAFHALHSGAIDGRSLRVFFACAALVAVREAAKRSRQARRGKSFVHYRPAELQRLTGLAARALKRALRQLRAAGVVEFTEGEIAFSTQPLPGSEDLLEALRCRRSPKRPIPVPRAVLRFLAQNRTLALSQTVVAYLVRGLSLSRQGGEVSHKGTVKVSWIADTFGLSERAVRYARAELVRLGWFGRDAHSVQRKLNRDGAYFVVNLDWSFTRNRRGDSAPLPPKTGTPFAPPREDRKTSIEVKHQKAQTAEPAGVCKMEGGKIPTLRNISPLDLRRIDRLEVLFTQAAHAGWMQPSEANALNFLAAAVRAREVGSDPPRLFVSLVRQRLGQNITQAQEERARLALARFREQRPQGFRPPISSLSTTVADLY